MNLTHYVLHHLLGCRVAVGLSSDDVVCEWPSRRFEEGRLPMAAAYLKSISFLKLLPNFVGFLRIARIHTE